MPEAEAKVLASRPRPRPEGRGRGQCYEAGANFWPQLTPVWPGHKALTSLVLRLKIIEQNGVYTVRIIVGLVLSVFAFPETSNI